MSLFEYVMILVSIIIGLAIAQMLEGLLRVLRAGRPYRTYWVQSVWVALIFVELVWHWVYRWDLQAHSSWTVWELLFLVLPTIVLFLLAGLLFPQDSTDLRSYYLEHRQVFFGLFLGLMVVYSVETWWLLGLDFGNRGDFIRLSIAALCVPLILSRRAGVHAVATVGQALVILVSRLPVLGGDVGPLVG